MFSEGLFLFFSFLFFFRLAYKVMSELLVNLNEKTKGTAGKELVSRAVVLNLRVMTPWH